MFRERSNDIKNLQQAPTVGSRQLQLKDLAEGERIDEWLTLNPVNAPAKGEVPSLRVNVEFLHEMIMHLREYNSLKEGC